MITFDYPIVIIMAAALVSIASKDHKWKNQIWLWAILNANWPIEDVWPYSLMSLLLITVVYAIQEGF